MLFIAFIVILGSLAAALLMIRPRCPRCGGKLINIYYDAEIDHNVYKCEDCGKEWI